MKAKKWIIIMALVSVFILIIVGSFVVYIDPFFHFHAPNPRLFYALDDEREQNDGMLKHFDYDAVIVGSSLTENFKTSEVDRIFGVSSIKASSCGASYKEADSYVKTAVRSGKQLKAVLRCLDMKFLFADKDMMRDDMGEYPTYLYDRNIFNDIKYLYNRDVIIRCLYIIKQSFGDHMSGTTSFDEYASWAKEYEGRYGSEYVLKERSSFNPSESTGPITATEEESVRDSILQNVVETAKANEKTQFYIYISPYSVAWWGEQWENGDIEKTIAAERIVIEELLKCDNVQLFSYNDHFDITCDLDNYRDEIHYGEWINSLILEYMKSGEGRITKDNYEEYLEIERDHYESFDYNSLF